MEWIDNIVIGLIDTFGTRNPYELCDALEIEIQKVDKENPLIQGNDSTYFRGFFQNEVILLRNDLDKEHEEFYLLHELGHAIIHTHVDNSNDLINRGKHERQANYFAFKIINLKFDEFELQDFTIEQVSRHLRIPLKPLKQLVNL